MFTQLYITHAVVAGNRKATVGALITTGEPYLTQGSAATQHDAIRPRTRK